MVMDNCERTAARMNEMRQIYLTCCKSIITKLEAKEDEFKKSSQLFRPAISLSLARMIVRKMDMTREFTVSTISHELSIFLSQGGFWSNLSHKKAKRFSKKVIEILETSFKKEKYPSDGEKLRLANLCMISTKQVNNWFTNKRNRSKTFKSGFITCDK